jgi:hypothetical protein
MGQTTDGAQALPPVIHPVVFSGTSIKESPDDL